MKIELLKPYKIGAKTYKAGTEIIVTNDLGKNLIQKKFAIVKEFISLQEFLSVKTSSDKAKELIENLPTDYKELLKEIKLITNIPVLEYLTGDSRVKIRQAALKRIDNLKP